jgi:hypothetical protein
MASKRIFLLDKSGSMEKRLDDTIGGFNAFVRSQVPLGGDLSLYTFSDTVTCEYIDKPIEEVPFLTNETYVPCGSTALFDSMGHILKKHKHQGTFVVLTDGYENVSKTYSKAHVKDLIESSELDVIYVGADIEQANEIGIENTLFYDGHNTPEILRCVSESVASNVEKLRQSHSA